MAKYRSSYSNRPVRNVYKPRSVRTLEKRTRNRLIATFIIVVGLTYIIITWGLPAIINSLSFLNKPSQPSDNQSVIEDTAIAPPVLNIPFEATSSSELIITGYSSPGNKVQLYIDDDLKTTLQANEDGSYRSDPLTLSVGTNNIYGISVNENKKSLPSKTIRLIYSDEKPELTVDQPQDNQQIKGGDKKVTVSGKTDPANTISVNGNTVIVSNDGTYSTDVQINDGDNTITIIAQNQVGNSTQIEKKVNYSAS